MRKYLLLSIAFVFSTSFLALQAQNWNEIINASASDAEGLDFFGFSVAIDGDYAIVGASQHGDIGDRTGYAYIFERSGNTWIEQTKLTASVASIGDNFGRSVSISGDYAIVGSHNSGLPSQGSVYVFVRSGNTWTEQAILTASDAAFQDFFGYSVSIDGNYAIIGAFGNDDNGSLSGSAYVFMRSGSSWTEQAKLTASDATTSDIFGRSVAINGDYAIVGAEYNSDDGLYSGSAYVFMRSGTSWIEQAKLTASDADMRDVFGHIVAIDGDYALIGARGDTDNGNSSGSAYVFMRSGTSWTEQAKLTASNGAPGDGFSNGLSIDGDYAIIGTYFSRSVYVYKRSGSAWTEQTILTPSVIPSIDIFGRSVAIDGDNVIVGAFAHISDDDATGSVFFFESDNSNSNCGATDTTAPVINCDLDVSINSCHEVNLNITPPTVSDNCENNFSLDFDGVDDFVNVNHPIGNIGTMEFWMYTENGIDGSENFDYIFTFNNSDLIYVGTGNVSVNFTGETLSIVTNFGQIMTISEDIPPGWNHVAITGNGSVYDKILLNGVSFPTTNLGFPIAINASVLNIGQYSGSTSTRFLGKLDEIRFWNTPRSELEIANNFEKLIDATSANLLAYYNFEDGTGSSVLTDLTSTGANGVLNNMDANSDWVISEAPITAVSITNNITGTSDASGEYAVGQTDIIWTATDTSGNTSMCTQTVTVSDGQNPEITCSSDITVNNDPGECSANVVVAAPEVSDNCTNDFALDFDGIDDYVALNGAIAIPSSFTIEAWVYPTSASGNYSILTECNDPNSICGGQDYKGLFFRILDGKLNLSMFQNNAGFRGFAYTSNANLSLNNWTHVAAVVNSVTKSVTLYYNGSIQSGTFVYNNGSGGFADNYTPHVGAQRTTFDDGASGFWIGKLDEIRVWDSLLSQTEIQDRFDNPLSGNEFGLLAYYDFEDGINSSVLSDLTSNANNGTLTNMDSSTDWIDAPEAFVGISLTNDFTGTSDASGSYPVGTTTVTWTATDPSGNMNTCTQDVTVNNIDCSQTYTFNNGVWSPSDPSGVSVFENDILIIESGDAIISTTTVCHSAHVRPGAGLIINSGAVFGVQNFLILESNSTSYSSFITDSGTFTGTMRYERFVNSNANGNDLITSPVGNMTWQDFLATATNEVDLLDDGNNPTTYAFAAFNKATGDFINFDENTGGQINVNSTATGFRVATDIGTTLTFEGGDNGGSTNVGIFNSGPAFQEWNLIGNPYPSYLKVQDFLNTINPSGVTNLSIFKPSSAAIYGYDGNAG